MRRPTKLSALRHLRTRGIEIATVLDVGAQVGTPPLAEVFPDRHHVLFEPVAEFGSQLETAYARIPHTIVQAAVSDRVGEGRLALSSVNEKAITHSRLTDGGASGSNGRPIPTVTLDSYLAENPFPAPYLLKIDIDGRELDVLKGAAATLKQVACLIIECGMRTFNERFLACLEHGFQLFDIVDPCYYKDRLAQVDLVLVPAGRDDELGLVWFKDGPFDFSRWDAFA